ACPGFGAPMSVPPAAAASHSTSSRAVAVMRSAMLWQARPIWCERASRALDSSTSIDLRSGSPALSGLHVRHLPTIICILRIALVWSIAAALGDREYLVALALFIVAGLSDGIDGYLAKRFNWISDLGKFLDPLADKLLLITVFVAAA